MGNVSESQQPYQRAGKNIRPLMGLPQSEKILNPEVGFSWSSNKNIYYFSEYGHHTKHAKL